MSVHRGGNGGHFRRQGCLDGRRQTLVREIDQRLLMGQNAGQTIRPSLIGPAQRPVHLTQCLPALPSRLGRDQVADAFGLHQVQASIEKGAAAELSRLRQSKAEIEQRVGYPLQDRAPSMKMKLGHILAGVGRGSREPDYDCLIQKLSLAVAQPPQTCPARWWTAAAQGLEGRTCPTTTQPECRDRGPAKSCHGGEDRIVIHQLAGRVQPGFR